MSKWVVVIGSSSPRGSYCMVVVPRVVVQGATVLELADSITVVGSCIILYTPSACLNHSAMSLQRETLFACDPLTTLTIYVMQASCEVYLFFLWYVLPVSL